MTIRQKLWLFAALAAIPLSLAAGWCWHRSCDPEYIASACLSAPVSLLEGSLGTFDKAAFEESFLSPEVVTAAAELLQERAATHPHAASLDSEIDSLLKQIEVGYERDGDRFDIELRYRAVDSRRALAVLTAVVEGGIRSLQSLAPEVADSATDERHRELAQLALALEQQQARISELEARLTPRVQESPETPQNVRETRTLEIELQQARELRIEAEDQLATACREVRSGASISQIVARLPDSSTWSDTRAVAGMIRQKDELRQLEAAFEAAGKIYGRNHPRKIELQTQIDQLRQQLAAQSELLAKSAVVQASSTDPGPPAGESLPATALLLLTALEDKCRQATLQEQELERQIASATAVREEQKSLEPQLVDARQELEFVQKEHERVRREIAVARGEAERYRVNVTESPALLPDPIAPSLPRHLMWAVLAGAISTGGFLRGFRRSPSRTVRSSRSHRTVPNQDRSRSREQDNLDRLRRLKPVA